MVYFRAFLLRHGTHLSDSAINRLIDGELPTRRASHAQRHLMKCSACRLRHEQFTRVGSFLSAYREHLLDQVRLEQFNSIHSSAQRTLLVADLDAVLRDARPQANTQGVRAGLASFIPDTRSIVAFASAAIVIVCSSILLRAHRNSTPMPAGEFLQRSVSAMAQVPHVTDHTIARETIQMRTSGKTLRRTLYRDLTGQRHPRLTVPSELAPQLIAQMKVAGICWNDPLSPAGFRDWHDRQAKAQDSLHRSGNDLLTLTTTVASGVVRQESMTVQASTFHPIERTVRFENNSTVEIAELDYSVVKMASVDASYFETPTTERLSQPATSLALKLPSSAELDEAELRARLMLNRLEADNGEQIQVSRNLFGIHINGFVETEERKHQLQEKLQNLPDVDTALVTYEDMAGRYAKPSPSAISDASSAPVQEISGISPLQLWLNEREDKSEKLSTLSAQLLGYALSGEYDSKAVADLLHRFPSPQGMTYVSVVVRDELLMRHRNRLLKTLREEEELLDHTMEMTVGQQPISSAIQPEDIEKTANQNLALTKELILGTDASRRSAKAIAFDLNLAIVQLRAQLDMSHSFQTALTR